jgi:hypothetical protein
LIIIGERGNKRGLLEHYFFTNFSNIIVGFVIGNGWRCSYTLVSIHLIFFKYTNIVRTYGFVSPNSFFRRAMHVFLQIVFFQKTIQKFLLEHL